MKHKTYGILHTVTGQSYYLLHPEPVKRDSWQNDDQQRWLVAKLDPFIAFQLVTSSPTIEFFDAGDINLFAPKEEEDEVHAEQQPELDYPDLTDDYLEWLKSDKVVEIVT